MSSLKRAQRVALALVATLAFASAAQAELPRQDPSRCKGQKEITPLQTLVAHTARGPVTFKVELADTQTKREYGLMCRRSLAPDRGMLFDFKVVQPQTAFWMRNTLIPLDIIYIRKDGTVLSIARNVQPLDETPVPSGGPTLAVLEVAAGRTDQIGLLPGDRISHKIFKRG